MHARFRHLRLRAVPAAVAAALALALAAAPATAVAAAPPAAAAKKPAKTGSAAPPQVSEVQGTCSTPRQAWLQLLYWLQQGTRWKPAKAAACFDTSGLHRPAEAGELAVQLKEVLDASGWFINVPALPTDPNYVDPATKMATFEAPAVRGKGVVLVKRGGRWLFSAATLARIPSLYPGLTLRVVGALPSWFRSRFLGVELWKYCGVLLLLFIALLLQRAVSFLVGTYLERLLARSHLLGQVADKLDRPIGGLTLAAVFYIGFPKLLFPIKVSRIALVATEAIAMYSLLWMGFRLIDILAEWMAGKAANTESKLDDQLVPLVRKSLKVFTTVVGGIFILQNLDVDVSSLLAGVGLGGLAFALAAKDTVANFFGSVMIFIDKPFQIGDWVVLSGVEGTIDEVGFRTTKIRTFYDSLVTVPNSMVVNTSVDNFGARRYRRYSTTLGLTYDTPPEKVQAFCEAVRAVIAGLPGMRKDYYVVEFKEFGASSLDIILYCFTHAASFNEEMRARSRLNLEILRAAEKLGVSFAFPTRTLHVDTLARSGESRPSHSGPSAPDELVKVIDGFGPGGALADPHHEPISQGYECGPNWKTGDDGE